VQTLARSSWMLRKPTELGDGVMFGLPKQ
jgi:hypothetical protein